MINDRIILTFSIFNLKTFFSKIISVDRQIIEKIILYSKVETYSLLLNKSGNIHFIELEWETKKLYYYKIYSSTSNYGI